MYVTVDIKDKIRSFMVGIINIYNFKLFAY